MKIKRLFLGGLLASSLLFAGEYQVDTSHSYVGFKIKHLMISNVKGNFEKFSGSYNYDEKTNTLKDIVGTISVDSINTAIQKRDEHLKSEDFFDVKKYPEIKFKAKKIVGTKIFGTLTMHGVTKDVVLSYEFNGTVKDPQGKMKSALSLNGTINRKDFNLTYNKVLEAGGVAIGEEVKLEIELAGVLNTK